MGALAMFVAVLAVPSAASAASKAVVDFFPAGMSAGVAVGEAASRVYVVDQGASQVRVLDLDGEPISNFGTSGAGDGELNGADQIAVDNGSGASAGSVYVADTANARVQKFDADGGFEAVFGPGSGGGELTSPVGVAVAPSGDVLVADQAGNRVVRFDSTGSYLGEVGAPGSGAGELAGPTRVAVDSTGRIYVLDAAADTGMPRVQRFAANGQFDSVFAADELTNFPGEIAIDRATDHVYAIQFAPDFSEQRLLELDPSGALVDTHAVGLGGSVFARGVATDPQGGRLYLSDGFNERVFLIDDGPAAAPTATMDPGTPVTAVTAHGATFNGLVNPNGGLPAGYHFEYSSDGSNWSRIPGFDPDVGDGDTDVSVSQTVEGLLANTVYQVRLVASKPFGAPGDTSTAVSFTTDAARPVVRTLPAGPRTDSTAVLGGELNPEGSPTTYYVEYSTDPAFATSSFAPASRDADGGAGGVLRAVSQTVTGLSPSTVYHFRLAAINAEGTTVGDVRSFRTRPAPIGGPDGRRFERVTPVSKNGVDLYSDSSFRAIAKASASGDALAYNSVLTFAGQGGSVESQYLARRGDRGWSTQGLNPPQDPVYQLATSASVRWFTDDLSKSTVSTVARLTGVEDGPLNLYVRDNVSNTFDLVSAPTIALPQTELHQDPNSVLFDNAAMFVGASEDLSHVLFEDWRQLTPDAAPDGEVQLYEWANGQVRVASVLPDGTAATLAFLGGHRASGASPDYPGDHAVSDDGSRIFFSAGAQGTDLYMRRDGTTTIEVSESEGPDADGSAVFQSANADGSQAFFVGRSKLTSDATASFARPDLYLWTADAPAGDRLTDLTTADPGGGGVLGVTATADDGSRVYFVATGDLADGAVEGEPNLYMWQQGAGLRHVATLDSSITPTSAGTAVDASLWSFNRNLLNQITSPDQANYGAARSTADGRYLAFASRARLTGYDTDGHRQIYLFDSDAVGDGLTCVSCNPQAERADGDATFQAHRFLRDIGGAVASRGAMVPALLPRNLSADASRVLFQSEEALVARDTNGKLDVYEWRDGRIDLISSGRASSDSRFVDASLSGDDVFFMTDERLVASDRDDFADIYDARVGGREEDPPPPVCAGDECQGALAPPPSLRPHGSEGAGRGNVSAGPRPSLGVRFDRSSRLALARGRQVKVRVRLNRPGRVALVARARLGRKARIFARRTKTARRPGTVSLPLRLTAPAVQRLRDGHKLRVTIEIRFGGDRKTVSFDLRRSPVDNDGSRR